MVIAFLDTAQRVLAGVRLGSGFCSFPFEGQLRDYQHRGRERLTASTCAQDIYKYGRGAPETGRGGRGLGCLEVEAMTSRKALRPLNPGLPFKKDDERDYSLCETKKV